MSLRCLLATSPGDDLDVTAEIVSVALFALGATAVGQPESDPEGLVLLAGFESEGEARFARTSLERTHPTALADMTIEVDSADWTTTQRAGLQPTTIGPWSIRAPWHPVRADVDSSYDIVIDPGAAFGHGGHPSTVMAIELLLRRTSPPARLIDVGTGTGVVAIIAARMGIPVVAIESDPDAVEIARTNIARNPEPRHDRVGELITLCPGDAATHARPAPDDVVVANVTIDVQRSVSAHLRPASTVILSGVLCRQVAEAASLYPDHECRTVQTHGEWASLELVCPKRSTALEPD